MDRKSPSGHVRFQVAKTELEVASISEAVSLAKIQPLQDKMQPGIVAKQKEESESHVLSLGLSLSLSPHPPTFSIFYLLLLPCV